ncbi:hypothetical protein IQ03_01164 [Gemmobacter caeni]|uniref:Uncharacterized protein n=1 Tax=Gemmobacter caeni TaxID=589035 RepID=A0A2T6B8I8_9RHOB|nr:hypothetical protein [Gemmobacter caeni]PTX52374.1 hypothetical protein C8N34_102153 [Gemmobacter caeni]TWJ02746.1 hypothetical protein IQ03_01164 [Gemmobacter caeni]
MGRPSLPMPPLRALLAPACAATLILIGAWTAGPALAQEMSTVHSGGRVEINAHGVCRRVHNGTEHGVMIPTKTAQEWATGGSSFLQNVPTGMTAYACVSPEVALRRWSRIGPPGQTGQPFTVNGADHGLTFTSVGVSTDGVTPSLVGNQIRYTPNSTRWRLDHLATALDTIPFEAIDSEGIAVQGSLKITLVGYDYGNAYLGFRHYSPLHPDIEYGDLGLDIPYDSKNGVRINMIFQLKQNIFDGMANFSGLMSLRFGTAHVIVIDNSTASMGAYSGPSVGDVNGDGASNTILDAQIRAALDFVDLMIANRQAEVGKTRIEGLDDPGEYMEISVYGPGNLGPSGSEDSGAEPIFIYTANATGAFVGQTNLTSYTSYRTSARSALLSIRNSGSNLNTSSVFSYLDGQIASLAPSYFTMAVHFLTPGTNSGTTPNLARFNQTGSGQLGTPVFAYYTGSNAASAQATFVAGLDHAGARRHLTSPAVFGAVTPPYPVEPAFRIAREVNGVYQHVRNPDGSIFYPDLVPMVQRGVYGFGFRLLPGTDTTCYAKNCQMAGVPTHLIQNYSGLLTLSGQTNRFEMQPIMFTNPIYRVHYDSNAALFNSGGVLWRLGFVVRGGYTALPPN